MEIKEPIIIFKKRFKDPTCEEHKKQVMEILEKENINFNPDLLMLMNTEVYPGEVAEQEGIEIPEGKYWNGPLSYNALSVEVDDLDKVREVVPAELLDINEADIPYRKRIVGWEEMKEYLELEIDNLKNISKRFLFMRSKKELEKGNKAIREELFPRLLETEIKKGTYELTNEYYTKEDLDNNPIFSFYNYESVESKNKIVSSDGKVSFAEVKIIGRDSNTNVFKSGVIYDGIIIECEKDFDVDTNEFIIDKNAKNLIGNVYKKWKIVDDIPNKNEENTSVRNFEKFFYERYNFVVSKEADEVKKIMFIYKALISSLAISNNAIVLIGIEKNKITMLIQNLQLLRQTNVNFKLSVEENLTNMTNEYLGIMEVLDLAIGALRKLEFDGTLTCK